MIHPAQRVKKRSTPSSGSMVQGVLASHSPDGARSADGVPFKEAEVAGPARDVRRQQKEAVEKMRPILERVGDMRNFLRAANAFEDVDSLRNFSRRIFGYKPGRKLNVHEIEERAERIKEILFPVSIYGGALVYHKNPSEREINRVVDTAAHVLIDMIPSAHRSTQVLAGQTKAKDAEQNKKKIIQLTIEAIRNGKISYLQALEQLPAHGIYLSQKELEELVNLGR